jgi:hypothetical protein
MHAVGGPLLGRVRRQSRVVVGLFDQVLGTGALVCLARVFSLCSLSFFTIWVTPLRLSSQNREVS